MTSINDFNHHIEFDALPADFRDAINKSQTYTQTLADDQKVGSLRYGFGYCSNNTYADTPYCACVNAPVANPECVFAPCTNFEMGYKTKDMHSVTTSNQCPNYVNCQQVFDMGGSNNVAPNTNQFLNCNGTVTYFINQMTQHPWVSSVSVILVISIVIVFTSGGSNDDEEDSSLVVAKAMISSNI